MKKLIIAIVCLWGISIPAFNQTTPVTRKVMLSLQPGEKIMYAESSLSLMITNNQVWLATKVNGKFYVYQNGVRKGPFDDLGEMESPPSATEENMGNKSSIYESSADMDSYKYISAGDDGSYFVTLKGKKYGPYTMISQLHVWPDQSGFFAISLDKQMNSYLITSEGLKVALNGDIEKIHLSPTGKNYLFAVKGREAVDMSIMTMDFSKMTQEEIMKFAKAQEEKAKNAPKPTSYVLVNGTAKYGPFPQNSFYSNNPGFARTGGGHWLMAVNNTLYIDGVKVKEFTDMDVIPSNTYVSQDGKRYAVATYNKIYFSDGKIFNEPMETTAVEKDGKVTLKWLSLENGKDLVLYSREL